MSGMLYHLQRRDMPDIRNGVLTMPSRGFVILPLGSWSTKPPTGVQCKIAPRCIDTSKRAAAGTAVERRSSVKDLLK